MFVPIIKSSPLIVKSPANVALAPLNVKAVVVPDLIIKLPEVFVALPKVVPPSLKKMSPPSASNIISVVASKVIVEPESISAITGVVNVLLVRVSVVAFPTSVSVAFGSDKVLSAVGSTVVRVVSYASSVAPSNTNAFWILIVVESTVVVVPDTVKFPVTVKLSATVTSDVVCPIVTTIPESSVAIFNAPTSFVIYELLPSWYIVISSPAPTLILSLSCKST